MTCWPTPTRILPTTPLSVDVTSTLPVSVAATTPSISTKDDAPAACAGAVWMLAVHSAALLGGSGAGDAAGLQDVNNRARGKATRNRFTTLPLSWEKAARP